MLTALDESWSSSTFGEILEVAADPSEPPSLEVGLGLDIMIPIALLSSADDVPAHDTHGRHGDTGHDKGACAAAHRWAALALLHGAGLSKQRRATSRRLSRGVHTQHTVSN